MFAILANNYAFECTVMAISGADYGSDLTITASLPLSIYLPFRRNMTSNELDNVHSSAVIGH